MMENVVRDGTGTAAALAGITVAGKTGTAQDCTSLAVCDTSQVWFIAYAPVANPQIAIAVTIAHQVGFGGHDRRADRPAGAPGAAGGARMTPFQIAPGTLIDDRYRVVSRVGSGGMAEVYCADDIQLGRRVAVKLLHERFAADEEFVERFRREASSAASLSHANIVSVYDRGEWGGTYYIAMEYLDGRSLDSIVREEAPLPPEHAIEITEQVLRAARFAHRRGVVHRDLKPHNVIVDEEGRVKVTDFGIARAGASEITQTGSIMGTARYLSPEQAQGLPVSPRSDLYSIGVMLYELLTGTVPVRGRVGRRDRAAPPLRAAAAAELARAVDLAVAGRDRAARAREEPRGALRRRRRVPRRAGRTSARGCAATRPRRPRRWRRWCCRATAFPPPVAPAHPATYTTQAIAPITGAHGHSAAAWWDPANTGQLPPGSVVLPPGPPPTRRRRSWPWVVLGLLVARRRGRRDRAAARPARRTTTTTTPLVPSVRAREQDDGARRSRRRRGYVAVIELIPSHAPAGHRRRPEPARGRGPQGGHDRHAAGLGRARRAVQVPTVVGPTRTAPSTSCTWQNFKVTVTFAALDDRPQAPGDLDAPRAAGAAAARARRSSSSSRRGPPPVVVPDLVGETLGPGHAAAPAGQVRRSARSPSSTAQPRRDGARAVTQPGKAPQGSTRDADRRDGAAQRDGALPARGPTRSAPAPRSPSSGSRRSRSTVVRHVNPQYNGQVISQQPKAGDARCAPATAVTIDDRAATSRRQSTGPSGPSTGPSGPVDRAERRRAARPAPTGAT